MNSYRAGFLSPALCGIVALTLLANACTGSSELWSQALVAILAGLLVFLDPPRQSLGAWPNIILPALFLLSLAAFLPAAWFPAPPWRLHLAGDPVIVLPGTRTPQPWLTAQACALMFTGLVWVYYVLDQNWNSESRLNAVRVLITGMALLSLVALAAYALGLHIPGWVEVENRGWFPSRNQTADVLAVCGVVNYALVHDALRKAQASAVIWVLTLVLIASALVVSYSRAGIVMFFGGMVLWHLWPVQRPQKSRSPKWAMLSLALAFLLLAGFFLFGGSTLGRFERDPLSQTVSDAGFRVAIQKDAIRFSGEAPWLGVGLGNFEPLFASTQQASANGKRAIHPESDWLWAACELGWLAPVLMLGAIVWWLGRVVPFKHQTGESLRRAVTVGAILFLLHGLVDVSGHRLASLGVGILLASLALPRRPPERPWFAGAIFFRLCALVMCLIGGWWIASVEGAPVPPTSADVDRLREAIDQNTAEKHFSTTKVLATEALKIAPVDWRFYFRRAYAEVFLPAQFSLAGRDFLAARDLESQWVQPCFDEGCTWLAANEPDLCIDAWCEALNRAKPGEITDLLTRMMVLSAGHDTVQDDLRRAILLHPAAQLVFLSYASRDETAKGIADLLAADPDLRALTTAQRGVLFGNWWDHGDRENLIVQLTAHPGWIDAGWPYFAQAHAEQGDFQGAWQIVVSHFQPPAMPTTKTDLSLDDLEAAFYQQNNLAAGIMLYLTQKRQGRPQDAIGTLHALEKIKGCPKYVYYLEAQLWAEQQQWELAWDAWSRFQSAS